MKSLLINAKQHKAEVEVSRDYEDKSSPRDQETFDFRSAYLKTYTTSQCAKV